MPDLAVGHRESAAMARDEERRRRIVSAGRADIAADRILTPETIDDWIGTVGTALERPLRRSTTA